MDDERRLIVAGAGICGLAVVVAATRAGWEVQLCEKALEFSEVGAGLQLGPNATRVLLAWGLENALADVASQPERIVARSAVSGASLAALPLGRAAEIRYGAPYLTLHRADLHRILLEAAMAAPGVTARAWSAARHFRPLADGIALDMDDGAVSMVGHALVGADGLHSAVRNGLLGDGDPLPSGDLAYRALLRADALPEAARANQITVWLGPNLHAVQYPVRAGAAVNLVVLAHATGRTVPLTGWDHAVAADAAEGAVRRMCAPLRELVAAARAASMSETPWGMWALADRPPVSGARQMARGRVALAGDAAHPMLPYVAQGAGMAIEDAAELGAALAYAQPAQVAAQLERYAQARWRRNARVQERARRNSVIFHARGLMRLGRDTSLRLLGGRLMDLPWLYGYQSPAAARMR